MDTSAWQACNSGEFLTPVLTDGGHVFRVRSTANGTSAFRSFTVDTVAPQITLDGTDDQVVTEITTTLTFSSPEDGVEFRCAIDSGDAKPCTSPFTTPVLANGTHSFNVVAVDPAGNQTVVSRVLRFAAVGPETTMEGPEGSTKDRKPTFALASSRPNSTFECKLDDKPWAACEAAWQTPELEPGPHTASARVIGAGRGGVRAGLELGRLPGRLAGRPRLVVELALERRVRAARGQRERRLAVLGRALRALHRRLRPNRREREHARGDRLVAGRVDRDHVDRVRAVGDHRAS